ncbi:MAG: SPOR domain-containing protein [Geminicoccaceae bacterium]|nr:SPOR domain-containing protein [Geminicoccaceae bacterium]
MATDPTRKKGAPPARKRLWRWLPVLLVLAVVAVFGFFVWEGLRQLDAGGAEIAVVQADADGYKRPPSPEEREGDAPLNDGSPVFADLAAKDEAKAPVYERILPLPDPPPRSAKEVFLEPAAPPPPPDGPVVAGVTEVPVSPSNPPPTGQKAPAVPPPPPAAAGAQSTPPPVTPASEPPPEPPPKAPAPQAAPAVEPAPRARAPEPSPEPAGASGGWRLQLLALRDRAATRAGWETFKARYPDILGGLAPEVVEGTAGGAPIFRLQAGPLPDRAAAGDACGRLKAAGGDCFVVGPAP